MYETGNRHGIRFHQEEPTFDEWAAHEQPTCSVLGLLKTVTGLDQLDQKRPYVVCMKLFKMNGLSCIGISRLMHELCVLT